MSALAVSFNEIQLNVESDPKHTYLMPTKEVAKGYGVKDANIRMQKRNHIDELKEGEHYISLVKKIDAGEKTRNLTHQQLYWTKLGVIYLGFFIKSERAKQFRKFAADLVLDTIEKKRPGRKALGKKLEITADQYPEALKEKKYISETRLLNIGGSLGQSITMQTWKIPSAKLKPTAFMPPVKRCINFDVPVMYSEPLYDIEDVKRYVLDFIENAKFGENIPRFR